MTGGPGTGKSTIIKGILSCYAKLNKMSLSDDIANDKILLAAPTGRAAKRMTEITKFKASTIHKALGYNINSEFTKGKDNELTYSIIIIDESSMIDIKTGDLLMLNIGTATTIGLVTSSRKNIAEVKLKRPVCVDSGSRIAISRRFDSRWRLIGTGIINY